VSGRLPERPPEVATCSGCGYPADACECASLFGEPDMGVAPRRRDDESLPWCPECDVIANPTEDGECGECGEPVVFRRGEP